MLLKKFKNLKNKITWGCYPQVVCLVLLVGLIYPFNFGDASEIDKLKSQISEKNTEMLELEGEILLWEKELEVVGEEKKSLNNELYYLNTTEKKLNSNINLTTNQIYSSGLKIEKLSLEIETKKSDIEINSLALAESIRSIHEQESYTLLESVLKNKSMSDFWNDLEGLQKIQSELQDKTVALKQLKTELETDKKDSEIQKVNLANYKTELADEKVIVENTKEVKNELLETTKNKESNYQDILEEKLALQQKLESELREFEAQLEYTLDKGRLPKKGSEVLIHPVKNPRITQYFGLTPFAMTGAYGYDKEGNPNPHRGVDFGVSIGTPMLATANGTVRYSEDMDAYAGCVSYGKWVLIDHDNGLSSFYAHLSLIKVSAGQKVSTGDIIGYSGNTGYSTGPHLHFSVFDRSAVKVGLYTWSRGCKKATVAYAPLEAYLNPMDYLPKN
ncbi:MAG: peptidoglycan DD-metalloendopeptidase family protein [Candidatus Pacebacteria bacterium]|nr:peptidoglycan DD-metalloendopeptidase family protein [Candidatus Paceibacterota bacterium]